MKATNSISKSFGGYSFYNSNYEINKYLRQRKEKKELSNNGFKVLDITLKEAIKNEMKQNANREKWNFAPNLKGQSFDKFGYKDKKVIYSEFGINHKKYKFKNGCLYVYKKYVKMNCQYFTIYVFTNEDRKIVKTVYYLR